MRIVFLDCDGVLNNSHTSTHIPNTCYVGLDDALMKNFKILMDKSNEEEETKIVLSSSWRKNLVKSKSNNEDYDEGGDDTLKYLKEELAKYDLEIFDYTPYFKGKFIEEKQRKAGRGDEILDWLNNHKDLNITNYLILDDDEHYGFDMDAIWPHWIGTSFYCFSGLGGLKDYYIEPSLEVLRGNLRKSKYDKIRAIYDKNE